MILNQASTSKSLLTLALLTALLGCSQSPVSPKLELISRKASESLHEFGKRACAEKGEGSHFLKNYHINCAEHGGFSICEADLGKCEMYEYPVPVKLSLDDLVEYARDKKVVLFGEDHAEDQTRDSEVFTQLIPRLKELGFTHIGLEVSAQYQTFVDNYLSNPSFENRERLYKALPFYDFTKKETMKIIDAASDNKLEVVCLDNIKFIDDKYSPIDFEIRDPFMKSEVDAVLSKSGRMAVFIGAAHVQWSKQAEFMFWGDVDLGEGISMYHVIKPLGRFLLDDLGEEVGLVDLSCCSNPYIPVCADQSYTF